MGTITNNRKEAKLITSVYMYTSPVLAVHVLINTIQYKEAYL